MIASARARALTEVTSSSLNARSKRAKAGRMEAGVEELGRASNEPTTAATLRCASRATCRYSAMPLPGLGAEDPPDGEAHPPASHPNARDNTSSQATDVTEQVFIIKLGKPRLCRGTCLS